MKSFFNIVRVLAVLALGVGVICGASIWFWWKAVSAPANSQSTQEVLVVIPKGASAAEIGKLLAEKALIKDPFVFRLTAQIKGYATKIVAGTYKITPDKNLEEILQILQKGPLDVWVTIPEGWRREQIAIRFENVFAASQRKFDTSLFLALTRNLEGRLFPDTYLVPQTASEEAVVKLLTDNFSKRTESLSIRTSELSSGQVLILASIIERETKDAPGERSIVAGILLKRLKNNWPLQADATLQYAKDADQIQKRGVPINVYKFWEPITVEDKAVDSPYNTYLHPGLPPIPIANPGLSAIQAVLSPQDSPYWYYLHGSDGQIHFARTIEEHQSNINKYL
jgi:UPF0755 protein